MEISIENAKYAGILNDDAPAYRLPDEILAHIFILVQRNFDSEPVNRSVMTPFLLHVDISHVSHRWRTIVLSTSLLWNTISFHIRSVNNSFERSLSQFDAHLLHSQQCFLDIDLHFCNFTSDLTPYFSRLAAHASRWRRLSIVIDDPHLHMAAFKELIYTAEAPVLEHLSLALGARYEKEEPVSPRSAYPSTDGTILASGFPALSFVRLAGYAISQMHPPLHSITTLHLDSWMRYYITPDHLTRVLAAVPHVSNLSLNGFSMKHSRNPAVLPQAVTFPHLRQLRLRGLSKPARFWKLIDAPHLDVLWLSQIDPFELAPLPSVRHVTLDDCFFNAADVARLARATPNVVALTAVTMARAISKGLLPEDPPGGGGGAPVACAVYARAVGRHECQGRVGLVKSGVRPPGGGRAGQGRWQGRGRMRAE